MTFDARVETYGLAAVFIGAGTEGEAAAAAGGLFAHRGLLRLWQVLLAVIGGTWLQAQGLHLIARLSRRQAFIAALVQKPAANRVLVALERPPRKLILSFRFIFGIRALTPMIVAASAISPGLFFVLNLVSAVIWGSAFTSLGYVFGHGLEKIFGRLPLHLHLGVAIAIAAPAALLLWWLIQRRRRNRPLSAS
ncbi:hypothetical protein LTR94_025690 [Friedmanniomyces endolithicus]|nr:hypothetical protein LTR94_025690 [Friedmanniomyces endolithicus]